MNKLCVLTSALLAASACATAPAPEVTANPSQGNSFAIRNVRVFDGSRVIERTNVVVRDGRIASVGRAIPRDLATIDGAGRTLLPGLIDAHAHVGNQTALRDALRFGVTTALDMLTRAEVAQANKSQRTRLERTNLADLYSAAHPITSPRGLGTQFGIPFPTISGPAEAPAFVRARIAEGSDYIKILYEPGAPVFTTITRETLAAIVSAAHSEGVLAVVHVSSVQGARDAADVGADGLAHGFGDTLIDEALARQLAARGMFVTPTLSIFSAIEGRSIGPSLAEDARLAPYLTAAQRRGLTAPGPGPGNPLEAYLARFKVDRAMENVRRMRAAGVRILAGTDAPNLGSHGVSLHGELLMLTRAGLSPMEALIAVTSAPAQAFKLSDRGRIVPGARADLVLVDGNPLEDIMQTRAITKIFKNGFEVPRAVPTS